MFEVDTNGDGHLLLMSGGQGQPLAARSVAAETASECSLDAVLVEAVKGGDREAFARLHQLYAPMVHGILRARVPYGEVSDLVQDVFLVAFKKVHGLRDGAAFGGWLAMIARNRAMEFHRRARETEELPEDVARPAATAPQAEAAEVLGVIRSLPDAYRETLVLRLVEGMTGPEIAARTGLHPDSVRVNLHRGMKLLRAKLGVGEKR